MRRRVFLRLLAESATVVATTSASGLLLESRRYCNALMGFEFAKPETWHYLSYQEYSDAGKDLLDDYDFHMAFKDAQGFPIVSIAQFYRAPPAVSPSIIVFGEVPDSPWCCDDVFGRDFEAFGEGMDGFLLEEVDVPVQLGDVIGARATYSYDQFVSETHYRMRTRCIAVVHRGTVLSFNFTSLDRGCASVLQTLVDSESSIRLVGPSVA